MKIKYIVKMTCLVLTVLLSCTATLTSCGKEKEEEKVVFTMGDFDITYDVYRYFVMNYKADGYTDKKEIEALAKESIAEVYATFALAEKYDIEADNEYMNALVDRAVDSAVEEAGGKSKFKSECKKNYMSENVFRTLSLREELREEVYAAMVREGDINTDKEVVMESLLSDEVICVKQILVMSTESSNLQDDMVVNVVKEHTDEEANAIATKAYERAVNGEDFDELVREYGESFFMFGNTEGFYLCRGMWDKVNEEAAFALEMGGVSEPVKSDAGWSVFKRCEKDEDYIKAQYEMISSDWFGACYVEFLEEEMKSLSEGIAEGAEFAEIDISAMK